MTENPSRRNFLRYAASIAVGGALVGSSVYFLDAGTREKVLTQSQQLANLQQEKVTLQERVASLQDELTSATRALSSNVVGYVFGGAGGPFSTIDLTTQSLIATSDVVDLHGVNLSYANSRLDAAGRVWAGESKTGRIFAIDPTTSSVAGTVQLPGRWAFMLLDLDPDGKYAYVLNLLIAPKATDEELSKFEVKVEDIEPSVIYKIDTATQEVVGSLQVERFACDVAIGPDGKFLYIPNQLDSLVTVVDLATLTVVDTIAGEVSGEQIGGSMITLSPGGRWLFLENSPSHNWSKVDIQGQNAEIIIDPSTRKIVKIIPLDEPPGINEFSPDGKYTIVTLSTKVLVIDTNTLEPVAFVPIESPGTLSYSPDSRYAYIPSRKQGDVSVVDLETFQVVKKITLTYGPSTIIPFDLRGVLGYKLFPKTQSS